MPKHNNVAVFEETLSKTSVPLNLLDSIDNINVIDPQFMKRFRSREYEFHVTLNDAISDIPIDNSLNGFVINSASAKRPGGGVTAGSNAQEENYCRRSDLYHYLDYVDKTVHYPLHEKSVGIYCPMVTFVRDNDYEWMEEGLRTNVVSLFSRPVKCFNNKDESYRHHVNAFKSLVLFANKYRAQYVVLPPIGCGVFGNDPEIVAQALKKVLSVYQLETVKQFYVSCYGNEVNFDAFMYEFRMWL